MLEIPNRRRRRAEDSDDEDDNASRSSVSQTPTDSKRIRLAPHGGEDDKGEEEGGDAKDEVVGTDDDDQEGESPTPESSSNNHPAKGKGPAAGSTFAAPSKSLGDGRNSHQAAPGGADHKPGAIVRIKLANFVTYTSAEFFPGPKLNMVIGPNGTGKSTLVCAICLGLGWGPQHLGRAKDAGEFVKHGCREATIEIELAGAPRFRKNPVICRTIKHEGNKSAFTVNGKTASRLQVLKLAQSFSIQIDNLCQFLPQDKVSEFAALSPIELLHSTQRAAAGPEMLEWHENLKKLRAEQKKLSGENKGDRDLLSNLENRQEMQRADVERMKQRNQIQKRIEMLELARPIPKYKKYRETFVAAKTQKDELERELVSLKAKLEPALRAVNSKQKYCLQLDGFVKHKRQLGTEMDVSTRDIEKKIEQHDDAMRNLNGHIEAERKRAGNYKQEENKVQQNINRIRREMEEEPADFDVNSYNEKIREKKRELREIETKARELKDGRQPLFEKLNDKQERVQKTEKKLRNLDSQTGKQEAHLENASADSARAYQWVVKNLDKFEKEVFGPPIVTCSIQDPKYADAVESLLQRTDFIAFTTQSRNDFRVLQRALSIELKLHDISIKTCSTPLSEFRSGISSEELRKYGFDGWAKDFLLGPEPVLAMLCSENRLHQTPIGLRDISEEVFTKMEDGPMNSWVSGKRSYQVVRRREYGPSAKSTRVRQINPARWWTDQPVDASAKRELEQGLAELKAELEAVQKKIHSDKTHLAHLSDVHNTKTAEKIELEHEKSKNQSAQVNFKALPIKLNQLDGKLKDIHGQLQAVSRSVLDLRSEQDHVSIQKAEAAIKYAEAVEDLRRFYEELIHVEVRQIEAHSDFETLRDRNTEVRDTLATKSNEVKEAMQHLKNISEIGKKLNKEAQEVVRASNIQPDLKELLHTIAGHSVDQLEADIDSEKARLELTHGGSESTIREFEERERQIQKLQEKLLGYENSLADYNHAINEIRGQWEPKLDALVKKISDAFSDSFARIGCAGQVTVDKVEEPPSVNGGPGGSDFDQWSIQIQVKFREQENLSILDSHRQSGGERAVSTIFYLMALQTLSASPFRVVDEINQGMDPRNERMVHERMVDIACAGSNPNRSEDDIGGGGGSQYFLITPKLLSGLVYKPGMKVLCIVSGEHMPEDYSLISFGRAISRMREISGFGTKTNGNGRVRPTEDEGRSSGVDVCA